MVTIECYAKAIRYGSKCIYQTVPRLLTLWLDMGAEAEPGNEAVAKATKEVYKSFKASPRYKASKTEKREHPRLTLYAYLVVYSISTNVVSNRAQQQKCLRCSQANDPHRAKGIPKARAMAFRFHSEFGRS